MAMDISDFSGGIVRDVDSHDAGQKSLYEGVNVDLYPGKAVTRHGTKTETFEEYTYDYVTRTHLFMGNIPLGRGGVPEEIVQIVEVKAPDARQGSIRGFTTQVTAMGTPQEHCINDRVVMILCQVGDAANREYCVYADIYNKDKFIRLKTFGAAESFYCADDSVPYMIARQSSVAVGNVITSTGERGVIVFQHIKGLYCWTRIAPNDYKYFSWLDEWRCTDGERFDAGHEVQWMLYLSSVERAWDHDSAMAADFAAHYGIPYEQAMKEITSRHEIGARPTNFNIKITAIYNGFQESRPLPFRGGVQTSELVYDDAAGREIQYGILDPLDPLKLPDNWVISTDPVHGQFARVRMNPVERFATFAYTFDMFPADLFQPPGTVDPATRQKWYVRLRWLQPWYEDGTADKTGAGFYIQFDTRTDINGSPHYGPSGNGLYEWHFEDGRRVGLTIHVRPKNQGSIGANTLSDFLFLLGGDRANLLFGAIDPAVMAQRISQTLAENPDIEAERNICRQLFTVVEAYGYLEPSHTYVPYGPYTTADQTRNADIWRDKIMPDDTLRRLGEFGLDSYSGRAVLAVLPYFSHKLVTEANDSKDAIHAKGLRALTGFRIYIKEDDVDIDYRLVKEIRLDYNPSNPDFGGAEEPEGLRERFRDQVGMRYEAPVWKRFIFPSANIDHIIPYYERKFTPSTGAGTRNGLVYRGGLSDQFIISDDLLTDRAGNSVLSQNMQRSEVERDAPLWIRGDICEGRLIGVRYTDKQLTYCIVGGGVPQFDICPREGIRVGTNDNPVHVVSWRGNFHLIFTDRNIYRMDFADGDELNWRILSTFAGHGTDYWRAIVNTPEAVFYVTSDGVFSYSGNSPQDMTFGFWKREFRSDYAPHLTESNALAGYDSRQRRLLFTLAAEKNGNRTWVFDIVMKAWTSYYFRDNSLAGYIAPRYTVMWNGKYLMSFGLADLRTTDFEVYGDGGFPQMGYTAYIITNELPSLSMTDLGFIQYIGMKYISASGLRYKLSFGPYDQGLREDWFPYKDIKSVKMPGTRTNFLHAIPSGIGRLWRIMVGVGSAFHDKDGVPAPETIEPMEIRLISIRGSTDEQWGGT